MILPKIIKSSSLKNIIFLFVFAFLILPGVSYAVDNNSNSIIPDANNSNKTKAVGKKDTIDNNVFNEFDKDDNPDDTTDKDTTQENKTPSIFSFDGFLKLISIYNISHDKPEPGKTDWRGLSSLKGDFQFELKMKFSSAWKAKISAKAFYDLAYRINDKDQYTDEVLDNYEKELELREAYLSGKVADYIDFRAGRQIVVWGKSDNLRVTDVLNPLDMRLPGLTDIEDLRLPVTMAKIDFYFGDWNLSGIAIPEIRFNKNPEYGSDFYPAPAPLPREDKPEHGADNAEYAVALNGTFSGWDISFYGASIYNDIPHLETSGVQPFQMKLEHARLAMAGYAFNIAAGNLLFKTEGACFYGLKYFSNPAKKYSRTDMLLGIEYSGFRNTKISLEGLNRHIYEFDDKLKQIPDEASENEFQTFIRFTRTFVNDTFTLTLLGSVFGEKAAGGSFLRLSLGYDIIDNLNITAGTILYNSGNLPAFKNIGDNDRLFAELKYSF